MANAGVANASLAPGIGLLPEIFKLRFVFQWKSMVMLFVNEHTFLFFFLLVYYLLNCIDIC